MIYTRLAPVLFILILGNNDFIILYILHVLVYMVISLIIHLKVFHVKAINNFI